MNQFLPAYLRTIQITQFTSYTVESEKGTFARAFTTDREFLVIYLSAAEVRQIEDDLPLPLLRKIINDAPITLVTNKDGHYRADNFSPNMRSLSIGEGTPMLITYADFITVINAGANVLCDALTLSQYVEDCTHGCGYLSFEQPNQ